MSFNGSRLPADRATRACVKPFANTLDVVNMIACQPCQKEAILERGLANDAVSGHFIIVPGVNVDVGGDVLRSAALSFVLAFVLALALSLVG